jgi:hypothetical protein
VVGGTVRGRAEQLHPRPRPTPFVEERPHEHGAHIPVQVLDGAHPMPVHVQRGDGLLDQIVGAVRVAAEQVREPA